MSYILEALKMSEQTRRQRVDGLQYSLLPAVEEGMAPRQFRPYVWLAGALLINAVALLLWWRPTPPPPASTEIQVQKALPEPARPVSSPPANIAIKAPEPLPALQPTPLPVAPPVITGVAPPPQAPVATTPAAERVKHLEAKPRASAPAKIPEATAKADNTDGMAANLMKQLPPINVAGYIHDTDSNRLVMVNDRLLREGEELAPGLKLEKILDDGLVFNFKGHRFKR